MGEPRSSSFYTTPTALRTRTLGSGNSGSSGESEAREPEYEPTEIVAGTGMISATFENLGTRRDGRTDLSAGSSGAPDPGDSASGHQGYAYDSVFVAAGLRPAIGPADAADMAARPTTRGPRRIWGGVVVDPELPGLLLCAALGAAALLLVRILPLQPYVPDVLVALTLGAIVVNTPLLALLGVDRPGNLREISRFAPGLKFVGRTLLRLAVVLMGFKIQARFFGAGDVLVMFCAIAAAMPTTFFVIHALALPLRIPRSLADIIAAGSMICGASAVNAVSPVVGAQKQEQGIALATIFLFSVVALLVFRPIATLTGMPSLEAGLWSGLAVNDLSSAVAVGAQMGPGGAEMAAASKSARIVLLAPILILFAMLRARQKMPAGDLRRRAVQHMPTFVAGFVVLALARALGDHHFATATLWQLAITVNRFAVDLAMMTVCAGIGFHLDLRGLLSVGARAVALGGMACLSMGTLTLSLVTLGKRSSLLGEALFGTIALAAAYFTFRVARLVTEPRPLPQEAEPIIPNAQ